MSELTIGQLIDWRRRETPRHVFCRCEGRDVTCEELAMDVNRVANALIHAGLRRGDRVGTMLQNGPGHIATMLAILRLALVWLPINHQLKGPSLAFQLTHADPRLLITGREFEEAINAASGGKRQVVAVASDTDLVGSLVAFGGSAASSEPPTVTPQPDDVVAISYTSGTTGEPKGVQLTDRILRTCARGVQATVRAQPGDVLFHWEPLHHIAGNQVVIYALLDQVTLAMKPRFSASHFWSEAQTSGARYAHYVGSVLQILLKQPPSPAEREHGVAVLWGGGCPGELWDTVRERFGVELREVWGMTETASITTVNVGGVKGSVGTALEPFDVAIQALDESGFAPAGTSGQIVVRAREPGVLTPGYFRNPAASTTLYRDSWLQTGDLGSMDTQGYVFFQGRLKDSLRRRGENISAWEVEAVINNYPEVLQSAVIGVPSDLGDDDIKAFVKVRDAECFAHADLANWCAERMPSYQIPRYIAVVSEFETTPTNRIRKESLSCSTTDCFDREADLSAEGVRATGQ